MISKNTTPVNDFSPHLWSHLQASLERVARETRGRKIAAFDADGTLWDADAGETFFDWQIHNSGLAGLPLDPWAEYRRLKRPDPRVAYVWLAQISAGRTLDEVRAWAHQCFAEHQQRSPWPVFESQHKLIQHLRKLDFEIFVVTASIKWAVEPAAQLVGIDHDHVIGIETRVVDNVITTEALHPLTWREGKAQGLLARTGGAAPLFASGNTYGDSALLECATHLRLAVRSQNEPNSLFEEEEKLAVEAEQRGWLIHHFRKQSAASPSLR
jgi:phosphoserine phosphatase